MQSKKIFLKFVGILLGLLPGNILSPNIGMFWIVNPYGISCLVTLGLICYEFVATLISIRINSQINDNEPGPDSVVMFTIYCSVICRLITGIWSRILIILLFERIQKFVLEFKKQFNQSFLEQSCKWEMSEVFLLTVILIRQFARQLNTLLETFNFVDSSIAPTTRIFNVISVNSFLLKSLLQQWMALIAYNLPTGFIGICFICFTELICSILKQQCLKEQTVQRVKPDQLQLINELCQIVNNYLKIYEFWMQVTEFVLGYFLLVIFTEFLTSLSINSFLTTSSANDFGLFHIFPLQNILTVTLILFDMVAFGNQAHKFEKVSASVGKKVFELKREIHKSSAGKISIMYNLDQSVDDFLRYVSTHPFKLDALGFFSVSRSNLTSLLGVIITYLIILIQFRGAAEDVGPPP